MTNKSILYHSGEGIVEFPNIRLQRYNKDFYFGFYCTSIESQAIRWATRFDGKGFISGREVTNEE